MHGQYGTQVITRALASQATKRELINELVFSKAVKLDQWPRRNKARPEQLLSNSVVFSTPLTSEPLDRIVSEYQDALHRALRHSTGSFGDIEFVEHEVKGSVLSYRVVGELEHTAHRNLLAEPTKQFYDQLKRAYGPYTLRR